MIHVTKWALCFNCDSKFLSKSDTDLCPKCGLDDWEYLSQCLVCNVWVDELEDTLIGELCTECIDIFESDDCTEHIKKYIRKINKLRRI